MRRVITDLDGTLVKGSIVLNHAEYLENKGIIDTQGALEAWKLDIKNEKLIVDLAMAYQRGITGLTLEEIKVNDYMNTLTFEDLTDAVKELQGSNVLLITGSPSFLAEPFAEILETIFNCTIKVEGSIYGLENNRLTGKIVRPAFTGKQEIINENPNFKGSDVGLGDTFSDFPILKESKRKILVNPNIETVEKFKGTGLAIEIL
jgi:phosphoserine phosphatase